MLALFAGLILTLVVLASGVGYAILLVFTPKPRPPSKNENQFYDLKSESFQPFPALQQTKGSIYLSVIVPAYNEQSRLPIMLESALQYLDERRSKQVTNGSTGKEFTFEVIVVDDGSKDETTQIALDYARKRFKKYGNQDIRVLTLEKNRGKGGAVTQGVLCARGRYILFADADGATRFRDVEELEMAVLETEKDDAQKGAGVGAIGSRAHLVQTDAVIKRSWIRNLLMYAFHVFVYVLCAPGVREFKDTQCGFKLFSRQACRQVFPYMHVEGWIFDIEVLHLAVNKGIQVREIAVNWTEVDGSKINLVRDSIKMAIDIFVIRCNYSLGLWKFDNSVSSTDDE